MSAWTKDELKRITVADDLHISPFREDGATYGTPTWIWSVVVGHELYVRPYNGSSSRWYKAAMTQKAGRITVAGITREVGFEPAEGSIKSVRQGGLEAARITSVGGVASSDQIRISKRQASQTNPRAEEIVENIHNQDCFVNSEPAASFQWLTAAKYPQ